MNQTGGSGGAAAAGGAAFGGMLFLLWLALVIVFIAGMWKTYAKAGQPGWGVLIPIFNLYCLVKIAGKPWWWLLLLFIPLVNIIIGIIVMAGVAKNFGKGIGFTLGLIFLAPIFYLILGFGDAQYNAAAA